MFGLFKIVSIQNFQSIGEDMVLYGQEIIVSLIILVGGLILIKLLVKCFKRLLQRLTTNEQVISTAGSIFHFLLIAIVVAAVLRMVGVPPMITRRLFVAVTLVVVGLRLIFRRYLPTLPYRVGNTIQVGSNLGKVEAVSFLNTRLKTFDGKTLFVPNKMILGSVLNNFHFTPTRRVSINVTVGYDDDLEKAKEILKQILAEDPRVAQKPAPSIYVMKLGADGVDLSARGWVENAKYIKTRSDCLEKTILRFKQAGITIPYPQRTLHIEEGAAGAKPARNEIEIENYSEPLPHPAEHLEGGKAAPMVNPEALEPKGLEGRL